MGHSVLDFGAAFRHERAAPPARGAPATDEGACQNARVPALKTVRVTRYVTPLREGGSLPAIVEADDDGLYVLKFRGAGRARVR
jgi:hypothetical protein